MQDVPKIVLKRLQETSAAAGSHPDADLLTAFAEQSLAEPERVRVMDHLARCSDCREVLALSVPAMELVAVAASSTPASATPARSRRFAWPVLRWGVAAVGIVALASIGIVQYRQHQKNDTLVSSLASRNETTAAPQALPQSLPAPQSQESTRQMEKEKQAQIEKQAREQNWALSNRADNSAGNMLVLPTNPAAPRAMRVAPSGTAAGGRSGSAGGAAPKVAPSAPRNAFAVKGGSKGGTPETAAKPAASQSVAQTVEAPSSSETIEVVEPQAAPAPAAKAQASDQLDEKQKELPSQSDSSKNVSALEANDRTAAKSASGTQRMSPRWSISANGTLQRSLDDGKTWLDVDVNSELASSASKMASNAGNPYEQDSLKKKVETQPSPSPVFRAVSAQGAEVWAGGSAAMLYHSADYGAHWARVLPSSSGAALSGDITSIEFSDPQHGRIATSAGEVWITADDGQSWRRQ